MQTEGQSDPNIQKNEEPRALQFITLQNGKFQISEQAEIFFENLQRQVESEPGMNNFFSYLPFSFFLVLIFSDSSVKIDILRVMILLLFFGYLLIC